MGRVGKSVQGAETESSGLAPPAPFPRARPKWPAQVPAGQKPSQRYGKCIELSESAA